MLSGNKRVEKMEQMIALSTGCWGVSHSVNLTLLCFYPSPNPIRATGMQPDSRQRKPRGTPNHQCSRPIPSQLRIELFSSPQQGT
jgi:hypothetical protein